MEEPWGGNFLGCKMSGLKVSMLPPAQKVRRAPGDKAMELSILRVYYYN